MNLLEYLDRYGSYTFDDLAFNEVDNLVFAELAYVKMDGVVGADSNRALTISQMAEIILAQVDPDAPRPLINDPLPLLKKTAVVPRFKNVLCCFYQSTFDEEEHTQFSAVTFLYSRNEAYIAYRGTDDTIVGWREDFNLTFLDETPGQRLAVAYLEDVARQTNGRLTLGGHSKGGNLAVYAAAFCDSSIRDDRIVRVYSNDGPGFRPEVAQREGYLAVRDKIVKFIPDSSIVGVLLVDVEEHRYIRSSAKSLAQHDPFTWSIVDTHFEEAESRAPLSVFLSDTLSRWLSSLEDDKRRTMVNVFFDYLSADGAQKMDNINLNPLAAYRAFSKAVAETDEDSRAEIQQMVRQLIATGVDVMRSGGKKEISSADDTNE